MYEIYRVNVWYSSLKTIRINKIIYKNNPILGIITSNHFLFLLCLCHSLNNSCRLFKYVNFEFWGHCAPVLKGGRQCLSCTLVLSQYLDRPWSLGMVRGCRWPPQISMGRQLIIPEAGLALWQCLLSGSPQHNGASYVTICPQLLGLYCLLPLLLRTPGVSYH